jgi:hypothetical protein
MEYHPGYEKMLFSVLPFVFKNTGKFYHVGQITTA